MREAESALRFGLSVISLPPRAIAHVEGQQLPAYALFPSDRGSPGTTGSLLRCWATSTRSPHALSCSSGFDFGRSIEGVMDSRLAVQPLDLLRRFTALDAVLHTSVADPVAVVTVPPLTTARPAAAATAIEQDRIAQPACHAQTFSHGRVCAVNPAACA